MFEEIKPRSEKEWLEIRQTVLTATDMGTVLGLNHYKSIKEMIEAKHNPTYFENSYTWLGQVLEPVVVTATNKVLGTDYVLYNDDIGQRSFFINRKLRLGATPDAGNKNSLLECKSTKPTNFIRYAKYPPSYYLMQLYTQLITTGKEEGMLSILSCNLTQNTEELLLPIHIFKVSRNKQLDDIVLSEVKRFWNTIDNNKMFRVNRSLSLEIELILRIVSKEIL